MSEKRYNIGLAVANILDPFSNQLSKGAMNAAENLDANLFIFPGKYLDLDYAGKEIDAKYDYQYNVLFSQCAAAKLDYLIVATGTIAYACNNDRKKEFLETFGDTPLLSVAAEVEGFDFLQFDNKTGIIQAVDYLAQEQGKKHIGMMIGDLNNIECADRYEAYLYALNKNDLDYKSSYVITSDISASVSKECEQLLDLNPELDAVMCANDTIASTMYKVIKKRAKRVGRDIAVVGFDDLPFAAKLEPPLASVRADAYILGQRAVEKAVNYLNGVKDDCHYLETRFIPRQSSYGKTGSFTSAEALFSGSKQEVINNINYYLYENKDFSELDKNIEEFISNLADELESAFIGKTTTQEDFRHITDIIDAFFNKGYVLIDIMAKLLNLAEGCYRWALTKCPKENADYLRQLYDYVHRRISLYVVADYQMIQEKNITRSHIENIVVRDMLMLDGNLQQSYASILRRLCCVGVDTGYLFLFKEPVIYNAGESFPQDIPMYFKSYHYGVDTFTVPAAEQKLTADKIYTHKYLASDRRHTMIAADLFSTEYQYGMALLEPQSIDFFEELELVTYQLSSAVKTIELLNRQEKMLAELHSRNLALENESKIDVLTKIYNRRGFYVAADSLISVPRNAGKKLIVCYADMDNLKLVNDAYGHIAGDFSLKSLADCLKFAFGDKAVLGRMGGDEYAVVALKEDSGEINEILARKEAFIEKLNRTAGVPYRINMSMGLLECVCDNSYDLKAAIDKADDKLYVQKSKRKKEI